MSGGIPATGFMALSAAKRWGIIAAVIVILGFLFWLWLDAYGDRRYEEGVAATDWKWEKASEKLEQEAAASATRADDGAVVRLEQHVAQVKAEQEQLDEAERTGSSPLDVLFGG